MALIVEDGTGKPDADSYASTVDADTRLGNLGSTIWGPLQDPEKEQALRRATEYLTNVFRARWKGLRISATQSLDWPRSDVYLEGNLLGSNVVPNEVKKACIDLALKAAAGDLLPDIQRRVVRQQIGPIQKEFDRAGPDSVIYRAAAMTLAPLLNRARSVIR